MAIFVQFVTFDDLVICLSFFESFELILSKVIEKRSYGSHVLLNQNECLYFCTLSCLTTEHDEYEKKKDPNIRWPAHGSVFCLSRKAKSWYKHLLIHAGHFVLTVINLSLFLANQKVHLHYLLILSENNNQSLSQVLIFGKNLELGLLSSNMNPSKRHNGMFGPNVQTILSRFCLKERGRNVCKQSRIHVSEKSCKMGIRFTWYQL